MLPVRMNLTVLEDAFAICKLEKEKPIPQWAMGGPISSITRTPNELSIVCAQDQVPHEIVSDKGWRCIAVEGPLDFNLVGILASLIEPLANAQISVFSLSTYDTDYLFVKERFLEPAIHALSQSGHLVSRH